MFDTAQLAPGQRLLIQAAAGGVGSFAVQLARHKGAFVIGTASSANSAYLRSLGAQEIIDYQTTKFEDVVRDVDVVFDLVGGEVQRRSFSVLKPGGILVSSVPIVDPARAAAANVRAVNIRVRPDGNKLAQIGALAEAGHLRPEIAAIFPLSEAAKALEQSKSGHTRGKIVLTMPQ